VRLTNAIVRRPGGNFAAGLTTATLGAPDFETAYEQHARYCDAFTNNGVAVTVLEPLAEHPDGQFVEDTAVLVDRRAILTRPGAPSRLAEVAAMREPLEAFFESFETIAAPGTLDGGDVCEAGNRFYIGHSHRTNLEGAKQLAEFLQRAGKSSTIVDVRNVPGILHLKSGMSYLGDGRFVAIDALRHAIDVAGERIVRVSPDEEYGANCVAFDGIVLLPANHPRLQSDLDALGYRCVALDVSEYRKMDGGLSCLSLRF
jgi:dimethylargininase